jgi:hypothetical protein
MHRRNAWIAYLVFLAVTATASFTFAATGIIISPDQYAWDDNGGYVNWDSSGGNVTVTDTALTGYIWSAGFGWINLSPSEGGVINNDGTLSGYAWGENTGWIEFTGVTIDSDGVFHGQTVDQSTFGTMTFDCSYCKVVTSWLGSTIVPPTSPTPPVSVSNGPPAYGGNHSYGYQTTATNYVSRSITDSDKSSFARAAANRPSKKSATAAKKNIDLTSPNVGNNWNVCEDDGLRVCAGNCSNNECNATDRPTSDSEHALCIRFHHFLFDIYLLVYRAMKSYPLAFLTTNPGADVIHNNR